MDQYITIAFLWLPGFLTWTCILFAIPGLMSQWSLDWTPKDQERWRKLRENPDHPAAAIPTFIMKDTLETPYLTAYAIALLCFAILVRNRRSTSQLESILF
jgi:hypothetical protein